MTRLAWVPDVNKRYEQGVDHVVLYPDGYPGVPWNGVISVSEDVVGGERAEYYNDGVKFADVVAGRIYQATIKAYGMPVEFEPCLGITTIAHGFSLTKQTKRRFSFSYRTQLGTIGYKIHIVYNATVTNSTKSNKTQTKTVDPLTYSWKIDAVPPPVALFKPNAHIVVDSTKATASNLALLEAMLYGTDAADPTVPDITTVINLFQN
jgi:hypothetical protein